MAMQLDLMPTELTEVHNSLVISANNSSVELNKIDEDLIKKKKERDSLSQFYQICSYVDKEIEFRKKVQLFAVEENMDISKRSMTLDYSISHKLYDKFRLFGMDKGKYGVYASKYGRNNSKNLIYVYTYSQIEDSYSGDTWEQEGWELDLVNLKAEKLSIKGAGERMAPNSIEVTSLLCQKSDIKNPAFERAF